MTQWGLDVLFNPAKRHMDEEKQRLQSTREEIGDASGGKRIDFESGKVTIERTNAEGDEIEEADKAVASKATEKPDEPDSAAARARARRRELKKKSA